MSKEKDTKTEQAASSAVETYVLMMLNIWLYEHHQQFNCYWKPKKDITTYELAKAMDILLHMVSGGDTWTAESLIAEAPENVKRHFDIEANA